MGHTMWRLYMCVFETTCKPNMEYCKFVDIQELCMTNNMLSLSNHPVDKYQIYI